MHLSNCQPDSHKPALASNRQGRGPLFAAAATMVASLVATSAAVPADTEPATPSVSAASTSGVQLAADPTGIIATLDVTGPVDESGAFFQSLGTNGRSCATCHVAAQAMGLS